MWGATLLLRSRDSRPGSDGAAPQEIGKLWQRLLPHAERLITDFSEWDDDGITRKQFVLTVQLMGLEVHPLSTPGFTAARPTQTPVARASPYQSRTTLTTARLLPLYSPCGRLTRPSFFPWDRVDLHKADRPL